MQYTKLSEEWIGYPGTSKTATQAAETYKRAVHRFSDDLTHDTRKVDLAKQTTSLQDLEHIVNTVRRDYESSRNQKFRKWLERFSSRLMYYGNIFDVLAQHHPEYVSLAWGAIKFLFVALLNHETAIANLAKALARIADALPRVELATMLYPTTRMMTAMEDLYAHIIQFLIRAHEWYREGTVRHILHSVTRPFELRYQDLLEHIADCSRKVEQLAVAGSQVELREMHTSLKLMAARLERSESTMIELKSIIMSHQAVNSASLVDTNQKVSDLQFSEMISIAAEPSSFDPMASYNQAVLMRNLRQRSQRVDIPKKFWQSPMLKKFADSPDSSLMLVKGTFQGRQSLRDAAVRVTEELHRKNIAALWAVSARTPDFDAKPVTPEDILKSLVAQAVKLNGSPHSQKSAALCCTQLRTAITERQWFDILGAALANFCQEIYIILELELLIPPARDNPPNAKILELFGNLFRELASRGLKLAVKVMLFTCRPLLAPSQLEGNILSTTMPTGPSPRMKQLLKRTKASYKSSFRVEMSSSLGGANR